MSQSSLQTSFDIEAPEPEIALILEAIAAIQAIDAGEEPTISDALHAAFLQDGHDAEDRLQGLREIHDSTGGVSLMVSTEREDEEGPLSIYGMENAEVAALGEVIRVTCPSALPMCFSYAYSDDKPHTGAFGGGVVMITADGVDIENSTMQELRFLKETKDDVALTDLQREALLAYDGEHGDTLARIEGLGFNGIKRLAYDNILQDGLALFVLGETSDAGGDPEEAARMMRSAAEQLETVANAMDAIAEKRAAGSEA
jgi:hypothetical protein